MQESLNVDGDTCIEFVPRKNEKDYVLFFDGDECSSKIGYQPGANKISLSKGKKTYFITSNAHYSTNLTFLIIEN